MRKGTKSGTKIARIRTYHLRYRLSEPFASAQTRQTHRESLLVQVVTDNGLEGWGECAGPASVLQAAVQTCYAPLLVGSDALQTDHLWHTMWRASLTWGRRGVTIGAVSGLDMALWDLKGHALKRTVSDMMGGRLRERIPCYATGLYFRDRPESELIPSLVEEGQNYIELGYRAVKAQIGRNPSYDTALIHALRRALPNAALAADACNAYDLPEATHIGRVLEEADFAWFEEALSPEVPTAYRQLSDRLRVPLAVGEAEQTCWGFRSLLESGGVSVAQPDLSYCGGPTEALRIRAIAASHGVNVVPHAGGTMLNFAAALHYLASDYRQPGRIEASGGVLGHIAQPNELRDNIWATRAEVEHGTARVPTAPGLGVSIDVGEMRAFCVCDTEVKA